MLDLSSVSATFLVLDRRHSKDFCIIRPRLQRTIQAPLMWLSEATEKRMERGSAFMTPVYNEQVGKGDSI